MSKKNILIVEDESIVADDLACKLRRMGHAVAGVAATGEDAVAQAGRLHPDLVLMDLQLQGAMDGIGASLAIQSRQEVPVIYLSAHSDDATLERAKPSGPLGYVLKPFDERDLAAQIELALFKHQADRKLREQREWLRVTLTSIGDAVIATDAAGRISFVNPAAMAFTGWTSQEAIGRAVSEVFRLIDEQTGRALPDPVHCALRECRVVSLPEHAALITKDDRSVPIEDSAAPILDAGGQVIGAVIVFHDVTAKRRAKEALHRSEERYRTLFESIDTGFSIIEVLFDADGEPVDYRILEANPAFEMHTGLHDVVGKRILALVPHLEKHWFERYGRVARTGNPERFIHQAKYLIGRWFDVFAFRVGEADEHKVAVFFRDITAAKEAQTALQQSEGLLKRAQEIAHLGSWELDLRKKELTWSDEVYRIFGFEPRQFVATYELFLAAVHPEDRHKVDAAYTGSLRDHQDRYEIEHRIVRPNGEIRQVHEKCEHQSNSSGEIIRSVGMIHDITEKKQTEEELRRSNLELEQFSYVASHDLQEPLRSVMGFLQLFQSRYGQGIDEEGQHFIERAVRAAHRMQTLIRDLLTLSRVSTRSAAFAPADLNQTLQKVLDSLQALLKEKNAQVRSAGLPTLTVVESQIQSLFQNLILNALRYNTDPRPLVEIDCREQDGSYRFAVQDNGIGITPQFHERIFVVFQRLHTESEYPGTGIGLALCKKIVERHGGDIRVESAPGRGTTFYFTLPKNR
jgi:PAS domain S-box-containing protein